MPDNKDRVALITGATSGIGRVTALKLAECGYMVFLAGRSALDAQQLIHDVQERTGRNALSWY